ncbi:FtsX-like permease family protein [Anaerococcus sp. AGMB09787]|uniref:FtsX-like permease family protein n=1 Tax=Anaerococcus sp. AGMB09787 TaxID=2922869 RepID=UPI001FB028DE|nr:FtsX-like permease family protein [Anaerococcus sp. AGMB09787]
MNKTYIKNIIRDIKKTKGKVISILVMVALATVVVVGLLLSGSTMRKSLDTSLKTYKHPDIIVRSTYGLDYEDEVLLNKDNLIETINFTKIADLKLDDKIIKVRSFDENIPKGGLTEGRFVENPKEITLNQELKDDYKIGDNITFSYTNDDQKEEAPMAEMEYEVVGFYETSDHFLDDMKEMSLTAKSEVGGYGLVVESSFSTDKYGEANIIYKDIKGLDKTSKDYRTKVKEKKHHLEDLIKNRPEEVLADIKADANQEIKDAEEEIADAENQLEDGKRQILEGEEELRQGFKDYEEGKIEYQKEISDGEAKLKDAYNKLLEGENKLDQGRKDYDQGLATFNSEIAKGKEEIKSNEEKIKAGRRELEAGKKLWQEGSDKLEETYEEYSTKLGKAYEKLLPVKNAMEEKQEQVEDLKKALGQSYEGEDSKEDLIDDDNKAPIKIEEEKPVVPYKLVGKDQEVQGGIKDKELGALAIEGLGNDLDLKDKLNPETLSKLQAEFEKAKAVFDKAYGEYEKNKNLVDTTYKEKRSELDKKYKEIEEGQAKLDRGSSEIKKAKDLLASKEAEGKAELDQALVEINKGQADLDEGWASYNDGLSQLNQGKIDGRNELKEAYDKLLDGQAELEEAKEEYNSKKDEAKEDIKEGKEEIANSKDAILRLPDPEYEVESIFDNQGIDTYYEDSLNIDKLSKVFPAFFYLVAMLVTLTTMKRYIDEQRNINGTLKALGYSNSDIANRFYFYGLVPTILGSIIGALAGRFILLKVIVVAYSTGFNVDGIRVPSSLLVMVGSILVSSLLIGFTVFISSRDTVKELPASLLRRKSPKIGGKILLEKIDPLWKRLSFVTKITFRNIFRYKSRMFMIIFGVAGCTALVFFGFAMIDSVKDTSIKQNSEISNYSAVVYQNTNSSEEEKAEYKREIDKFDNIEVYYENATLINDDDERDITIVSPENDKAIKDFIALRTPSKEDLDLASVKAILSEGVARDLDLSVGDVIRINLDTRDMDIEIGGVNENYVGDYLYISNPYFKDLLGEEVPLNANFVNGDVDQLIKEMKQYEGTGAILNTKSAYDSMDALMENLNLVMTVITLMSAILAMVVLYNITSINIGERRRELATVKVLGFYPREVTAYIYREIFTLTILGIFVGYILGYMMFRYICYVVAPDGVMLSYTVHSKSFIIGAGLTLAISIIILVYFNNKLKKIDMAEAMSSGD